jgi:predicted lipoprotein with Yx(FWY)xxD motif
MRPLHAVVMGAICLAFVAAGCGGAIPSSDRGPAVAKLMTTKHGRFLADAQGHTLYLFLKDGSGESYCTDACAAVWPPFETSSTPRASAGVNSAALGTFKRGNGELQVTYHGHPLYYYAADASTPGQTKGEALTQFGAPWCVVTANGQPLQ